MKGKYGFVASTACAVAALVLSPAPAGASFPGANGKIVFESQQVTPDDEIFVMDIDGQNQARLTQNSLNDEDAVFSADGEKIAWSAPRPQDILDDEIWSMNADGQSQVPLTDNAVSESAPAFSPDGKSIAYSRFEAGDDEIFVMDADGQNQVPLTDNMAADSDPVFSPDGQSIAFASNRDGNLEIYVMDADGQSPVRLTETPGADTEPSFSPDGQRIAFESARDGDDEIFVMDANGQNEVPLTQNTVFNDEFPAFSPDGQRIAFSSDRDGEPEILVMDADGQNQAPLTTNSVSDAVPDWQPLNPPACDLSAPAKQKSFKVVTVAVTCTNENATVAATGQGRAPKVPKLATVSKAKRFTLEPTTIEVQPDQPTALTLAVPKKGKKALKKAAKAGKKGKATVTITATDDFGESSQDSLAVKFKKKNK